MKRAADGALLRVSEAFARRLLPSEIVVRGRRVFGSAFEGKIAKGLTTECDGKTQALSRGDVGWSFESPSGYKADTAVVQDLVNIVLRAEADSWVADADDGTFGFGSGGCAITLTYDQDGGPRRVGIVFGREDEGGGVLRARPRRGSGPSRSSDFARRGESPPRRSDRVSRGQRRGRERDARETRG